MSTLTFDGVLLTGPIKCEDIAVLRSMVFRGDSRLFPGATGRRGLQKYVDELHETLTWKVHGLTTVAGASNANTVTGLEVNLEYYRALFTAPDAVDPSGVALSLSWGGSTFTGTAQVAEYAQQRVSPQTAIILTHLVINAGVLT